MENKISSGLKNVFLIHFIIGLVFGLVYLLIPELYGSWVNWPVKEPDVYRLLGAALIGYSGSSWFALKNPVWDQVKLIVLAEIIWCGLGTLVMLWGMLISDLPEIGWMNTGFLAVFTAGFAYYFMTDKS